MIRFGPMSIVLLLGACYGIMRAAMLWWTPPNRAANRMLALLLLAVSLFTFPYIVGFAGYYDAYPWLSYFPYKLTLAFGPLLYCHCHALLGGGTTLPPRWGWHFVPALLQFAYYFVIFSQPLAFKNDWDTRIHVPYLDPAETVAMFSSVAAYWVLCYRRYRERQVEWIRNLLVAMAVTMALWGAMLAAEWIAGGLSYFQRFPFYLWLSVLVCYLGTEGYRHGVLVQAAPRAPKSAATPAELGERWRARIIAEQWWREPDLTLASLARLLGTNTTALSKAVNEGLGLNLNEMLNRIRIDAVIAAFDQPGEERAILDIALAEGFSSKASFNRAFKLYTGQTPSDYRRRQSDPV